MMSIDVIISISSLAGSAIAWIAFYSVNKRAKHLENEDKAAAQWQKLYYESKADSEAKEAKIAEKDEQIRQLYEQRLEILQSREAMSVENTRLMMLKCEVVGCKDRKPPTGY